MKPPPGGKLPATEGGFHGWERAVYVTGEGRGTPSLLVYCMLNHVIERGPQPGKGALFLHLNPRCVGVEPLVVVADSGFNVAQRHTVIPSVRPPLKRSSSRATSTACSGVFPRCIAAIAFWAVSVVLMAPSGGEVQPAV